MRDDLLRLVVAEFCARQIFQRSQFAVGLSNELLAQGRDVRLEFVAHNEHSSRGRGTQSASDSLDELVRRFQLGHQRHRFGFAHAGLCRCFQISQPAFDVRELRPLIARPAIDFIQPCRELRFRSKRGFFLADLREHFFRRFHLSGTAEPGELRRVILRTHLADGEPRRPHNDDDRHRAGDDDLQPPLPLQPI